MHSHLSLINIHSFKNISNRILQRTKQLTLSGEKYKTFLDTSLKESKENIMDKSNNNKLPIINIKHSESQKNITSNNEYILENIIIPHKSKNFLSNKNLNNKKIKFFISELNKTPEKEEKETNFFQKNKIDKIKKILKFPFSYKSPFNKNFYYENFNNSKKESKKKEIFILLDSIFSDKNENKYINNEESIKYDEKQIFGYKNEYKSYLKNELNLIYTSEKEIDNNSNIMHEYDNRIYGKIKLELKSANITLINTETNDINYTINIPFCFLCLLYLSHIKELAYIVLSLFKNENLYKKNLLNELKNIITKKIKYVDYNLKYNNNIDEEYRKNILTEYLNRRNIKNRQNIKYNFLSLYTKKEAFKQIKFENCTYINDDLNNIIYNSTNKETLKILFDTNINIINYSWISLNNNYNIKITMPQIKIYLIKFKKELNLFINRELLIYLLKNNFKNWNSIIVHYLFTLKNFRINLNKALSYNNLFCSPYFKRRNLSNYFFTNISSYKVNTQETIDEYNNYLNINFLNNEKKYEIYQISNINLDQYENSLNDNEYIFFVSDFKKFHLYKMKSYTLYIYFLSSFEEKNPKIFYFNLSFYHMKILFFKSKYDNIVQFLQRLLKYDKINKKIYLDYNYFSSFKYMNLNQIDKYFKESRFDKNDEKYTNEVIDNDIILRVVEPTFISISVNKNNNNEEEEKTEKNLGSVGRNLIKKLIENDIKDWGKILWENKNDIEPLKNKKLQKNLFSGKKGFQSIFKKFLNIK